MIGGTGFIGRHLVSQLTGSGAVVRVVGLNGAGVDPRAEWMPGDVRDAAGLGRAFDGMDLIYNLAATHGLDTGDPGDFRDVNVGGAHAVCAAAAEAGVPRIIFTSSAAVYGHGRMPDERSVPRPVGHYGITKLEAEAVYRAWAARAPSRSLAIVRPTVVFGPGAGGTGGRLLRHLAGPRFAHVGRAQNRKSLAYVHNLAAFLAFVRQARDPIQVLNYADMPDLTLVEIAAIVRSAVGLTAAPHRSVPRAWASHVRAALAARLEGQSGTTVHMANATIRRLAYDMRFNATRAHQSGFRQPVGLRDALAATARIDVAWVALLSRSRE